MVKVELSHKPPAEIDRIITRYSNAWQIAASNFFGLPKSNSPEYFKSARKLLDAADYMQDQLALAMSKQRAHFADFDLQLTIIKKITAGRVARLEKILESDPGTNPELQSDLERELAGEPLYGVLTEMETTAGHSDSRDLVFRRLIQKKTKELIDTSPPAAWNASEKKSFLDLMASAFEPLIEYGLFKSETLSTTHITVKDPNKPLDILKAGLEKSGSTLSTAISFNQELNKNPLVGSLGIDEEMFSPRMGVVQAINCVMYFLMKTKGSPGNPKYSSFSRSEMYGPGQSNELIDFICEKDDWKIVDASGATRRIPIKLMINRFPPEVGKLLKHVALFKASRDDLGQHASNYIMFKNGNSPKLDGTGSNSKGYQAGMLARMTYDVANTSNRGTSLVKFSYIDPRKIKEKPLDFSSILYKKRNRFSPETPYISSTPPGDSRALTVLRQILLLDVGFEAEHAGYLDNARKSYDCEVGHWYSDFPALYDFMNMDIDLRNDASPGAYAEARNAMGKINDAAARSVADKYTTDPVALEVAINTKLRDIFTQYAIFSAYVGPGFSDPKKPHLDRYIHYHKATRGALKFMLFNIINSLPASIQSKVDSGWSKLLNPFAPTENEKALEIREQAIEMIVKQIKSYSSLGSPTQPGSCAQELIDFLHHGDWLAHVPYREKTKIVHEYNAKRLAITDSEPKDELGELNALVSRQFNLEPPPKLD